MSFNFPLRTDKLSIFIKLGRQIQRTIIKQSKIHQNLINEILELIFDKKLTVSILRDLCLEHKIEMKKALFLYSNNQEIILQLILEQLEDYSIIEYAIINQQFPKNQQLIVIVSQLLKKLRPSIRINQVQMSIDFLKKIKKTEQIQILIDSLKLRADINTQNQIVQAKNLVSYFDFRKLDHVKLLGQIANLFGKILDKDILNVYKDWKKGHIFRSLKLPKNFSQNPGNDFKIELEKLNYNIFHEIANRQIWQQFIQYSNPYYHQKSIDNRTPFWIFFQNAPIQIILDYIKQYPNELEQNMQIITNKGFTLIHCLCKNNNIHKGENDIINQLISILDKIQYTRILLNIAYQDQIPLVYYLDFYKIHRPNIIEFLSRSLIKQFNFENLEIQAYQIADEILNKQIQIKNIQPNFNQLTKKQKQIVQQQWILNKDENKSQSEYLEFTQFYQHYIQLAKQIIKNNLFDQFPWIINYSIYSCHIPFDIGNVRSSLLYTLLVYQKFEKFNSQIQTLCILIQSFKYDKNQSYDKYSNIVQQISRLLFIYQELFSYSELQSTRLLIAYTISNLIKQNPEIILNKVYGLQSNQTLAENLFLQYLMKITMSSQEYIQFLGVLLSRFRTDLYEILISPYYKSYRLDKIKVEILNQQISAKNELKIKLKNVNTEFGPKKINVADYEDILRVISLFLAKDFETEVFVAEEEIFIRSNALNQIIREQMSMLKYIYESKKFTNQSQLFKKISLLLLFSYRNLEKQQLSNSKSLSEQNMIVNLSKIFNSNQLIQYLFNQSEIDCKFQEISKNLTNILNKDITISIHQQSLINAITEQIAYISRSQDSTQQLRQQFIFNNRLIKLKNFFLDKLEKMLVEQLFAVEYEKLFKIMISKFLHSLRQRFDLQEQQIPNYRRVISVEKTQAFIKLGQPNQNVKKLIKLSYGFQLQKLFYLCQYKIGDLLYVCFKNKKLQTRTVLCQLIKIKLGHLTLKTFSEEDVSIITEEQVQQCNFKLEQKSKNKKVINFYNLITIIKFMKSWPNDQNFINNVLNVYITDQNGNLYFINDLSFLRKMSCIQETSSDQIRKQLIDKTFGKDQISYESSFAISEILPIFPKIIQFYFIGDQEVERKEQSPNFKYIDIKITEQEFEVINMRIDNFNTACYFDTHFNAQQKFKKLINLKDNHKELGKIEIIIKFSDSLDDDSSLYLDQFFQQRSSFEEFQGGYEEFLVDSFGFLTQYSLNTYFDISEIEIKKKLLNNLIKSIEFRFDILTQEKFQTVEFKDGKLLISSFIKIVDNQYQKIVPQQNEICLYLRSLIIQDQNLRSDFFIENQLYDIHIVLIEAAKFFSQILSLLILVKYLYRLVNLKKENKINKFIITQNDYINSYKGIYRIEKSKNQVQLYYENFVDLNLQNFLLDYLNGFSNQTIQQSNDQLQKKILQQNAILTKPNDFQKYDNNDFQLYISYDYKKLTILDGWLYPYDFESALLILKKNGKYIEVTSLKSYQKFSHLVQYKEQNPSQENFCSKQFIVLVGDLTQDLPVDEQLKDIQIVVTKDNVEIPFNQYISNSTDLNVEYKFITFNILLIQFSTNLAMEFKLKSQKFFFSAYQLDWHQEIILRFHSCTELQIGYHTEIFYKNELKKIQKEQKRIKNYSGNLTCSLIKHLINITSVQSENFNFRPFQRQKINLEFIQQNSNLNIKQLDQQYSTRAREERTDTIEFEDDFGNVVKKYDIESCVFVHSIYYEVQVKPETRIESLSLKLIWTPQIKGIYLLYINKQQIEGKFIIQDYLS